ncbi:hypothetical protein JZM60_11880 [Geobacter benzoatilyticus]|uniref:Bacterial repeat domain-containing protein n=1 Tax=Geobacter benzoatilyticus TaxID=2815309 RepID=A0ABX7Q7Q7_9BACT|nr:hypothetical protein JZM60_11880 [Geobacter benzoatilyticus]
MVVASCGLLVLGTLARNADAALNDKAIVTVGITPSLSPLGSIFIDLLIPAGTSFVSAAPINEADSPNSFYISEAISAEPINHAYLLWMNDYGITTTANPVVMFEYDIPAGQTPSFDVYPGPDSVSLMDVNDIEISDPLSRIVLTTTYQHPVNVTVKGVGSGTITSTSGTPATPGNIACTSDTCTSWFDHDGQVTLIPVPSIDSYFKSWTGGGCSGNGNCVISSLSTATDIQAEFARLQPVRIAGTSPVYYDTLQGAYNAATTGAVIQALTTTSTPLGTLTMNGGKAVTLKGGYNGDFSSNSGYTTSVGTLTVVNGTLIVENVVVN